MKLYQFKEAKLKVHGNEITSFAYGVWARTLDETTHWYVYENRFESVPTPIFYDASVKNPPHTEPEK